MAAMELTLSVICLAVLLLAVVTYWGRRTRRGSREPFVSRPSMTIADLHAAFYAHSAVSQGDLAAALGEIGRVLGVPVDRLRPSDRFDVELAPEKGWEFDDPLAELTEVVERRLRTCGLDEGQVAGIRTVDDFVRLALAEE